MASKNVNKKSGSYNSPSDFIRPGSLGGLSGKPRESGSSTPTYTPPSNSGSGSYNAPDISSWGSGGGDWSDGGGGWSGGGGGISAAEQRAIDAENKAKKQGKDQTAKENANTQKIIDTLLSARTNYLKDFNTLKANATSVYNQALKSADGQYKASLADLNTQTETNEKDESAKTYANRSNEARERMALLDQAASQGAGETDQLRTALQAVNNAAANQLEINTSFNDTLGSIRSALSGLNSQTVTARRNAWGQKEDAFNQATDQYNKNMLQMFTDVQRTAASNNNIDSDYSTEFKADFKGFDPVKEAAKYTGQARKFVAPKEADMTTWGGKRDKIGTDTNAGRRGSMVSIGPAKSAQGADLRKWSGQ